MIYGVLCFYNSKVQSVQKKFNNKISDDYLDIRSDDMTHLFEISIHSFKFQLPPKYH